MTILKKIVFILLISLTTQQLHAQVAGKGLYYFMNMPQSARAAALGGNIAPLFDRDVNVSFQNPSSVNSLMDKQLAVNYLPYFDGINAGYFAYGMNIDKKQAAAAGLMYYNYGKFDRTDAQGNENGSFGASDYLLQFSYNRLLHKKFYGGTTFKTIYSQYEKYKSLAFAFDIASSYADTANQFVTSLVLKNIGFPVINYIRHESEPLPFEIQLSMSKKLKYAPFRFIIIAHNLQKYDLTYETEDPRFDKVDLQTQEVIEKKITNADKIMRHFIFATELIFSKNFNIRFGYNHKKRMEMSMPEPTPRGFTGFAWGFGLKMFRTNISYANAGFFPGRGTHQVSLLFDLNDFKKQKNL